MAFVVTRLCRDCVDTDCITVCPVDCFYIPKSIDAEHPNQLYISPDECINCDACVAECPWEAIFDEADVPAVFADDTALNAKCDAERDRFQAAEHLDKPTPDADAVEANKKKWGLGG
jgi:ferredoxin